MAGIKDFTNIWKNLKEVDLRPYQEAAIKLLKIALAGRPGTGRHTLAGQMRRDLQREGSETQSALLITDLTSDEWADTADLIILLVDAAASDVDYEHALAKRWGGAGKTVLTVINEKAPIPQAAGSSISLAWDVEHVLRGSITNAAFLQQQFIPTVLERLPERHLALARQFPLFRPAVARKLINESSKSNGIYALSTGMAEVIPIFDIPLNIADMVVLTKAQAFLVYKLGLALGFSTRWEDYLAEFGSVIGGGFLWRQLSRMLVGLIPVWGIIPKVTVAYSGTYAVGHVVLQWYLTREKLTGAQMRTIYTQSLDQGRKIAQEWASHLRLPKLRRKKAAALPAGVLKPCPFCGKNNAVDAVFCQYCGQTFQPELPPSSA